MVANSLPYCGSLATSPRQADRLLWLRIATDVTLRAGRPEALLGADWEANFETIIDQADDQIRLEVAKRLSASGRTLARFSAAFLRRPDAAAEWTLEHASNLPETVLVAALPSQALSAAVARRADLGPNLVDQLLSEGAIATLIELAGNLRLRVDKSRIIALISRAATHARLSGDLRLARALLRRAPLTIDFAPLFLDASSAQRSQILLAAERAAFAADLGPEFSPLSAEAVAEMERHGLEGLDVLFVEDLARALDCDPLMTKRIVEDPSGEPLAVTLAALGAPNDVCVRLLTARDMAEGPDYPRLSALARLQGALSPTAAGAVVRAFLGQDSAAAQLGVPAQRRVAAPNRGADIAHAFRRDLTDKERRIAETG